MPWLYIHFASNLTLTVTSVPSPLKVNNLEERLTEWRLKLKHLRTDYDKLLFFYIPKMLRMFKMLHSGSSVLENVPQLVQEVSFLFDSTVETRQHLTASLQVGMLVWCVCVCVHVCVRACVHAWMCDMDVIVHLFSIHLCNTVFTSLCWSSHEKMCRHQVCSWRRLSCPLPGWVRSLKPSFWMGM